MLHRIDTCATLIAKVALAPSIAASFAVLTSVAPKRLSFLQHKSCCCAFLETYQVHGIWFYESADLEKIAGLLQKVEAGLPAVKEEVAASDAGVSILNRQQGWMTVVLLVIFICLITNIMSTQCS